MKEILVHRSDGRIFGVRGDGTHTSPFVEGSDDYVSISLEGDFCFVSSSVSELKSHFVVSFVVHCFSAVTLHESSASLEGNATLRVNGVVAGRSAAFASFVIFDGFERGERNEMHLQSNRKVVHLRVVHQFIISIDEATSAISTCSICTRKCMATLEVRCFCTSTHVTVWTKVGFVVIWMLEHEDSTFLKMLVNFFAPFKRVYKAATTNSPET